MKRLSATWEQRVRLCLSDSYQPRRCGLIKRIAVLSALAVAGVGHLDHMSIVADNRIGEDSMPRRDLGRQRNVYQRRRTGCGIGGTRCRPQGADRSVRRELRKPIE